MSRDILLGVGQVSGNKAVFEAINNSTSEVGRVVVPANLTKIIEANFTRSTAATQTYDAGDVVSGSTASTGGSYLTFSNMAQRNGGGGVIMDAIAIDSAFNAVKPSQRLYLFSKPVGTTVLVDGSVWLQPTSDMRSCVAEIEFAVWATGGTSTGGNAMCHNQNVRAGYVCESTDASLYGVVVERGSTFVGAISERWDYRLKVQRD